MSPTAHLALINVLVGDIQGGLGPFLAAWLAERAGWSPGRVGSVLTAVGLATLVISGPAGALVDRLGRPRLLLGLACAAILVGTLAILPARGVLAVTAAQFVAASGGTLLVPALTALTLGLVGKARFPRQQGRNQAFNHVGIVAAAGVIAVGTPWLGPSIAFWVLGGMASAAVVAVATFPGRDWNGRRAHGWSEEEPDHVRPRGPLRGVFGNRRLLALSVALALFNVGNGSMLALLSQRLVAEGHDGASWTAIYVVVAQLVMVPTALYAGSLADRRGRRGLLLLATAILPARAVLSALASDPAVLVAAEVLDGVAAGILGVAVPVVVADLTWTSGRTQTALGTVNAVQGLGGALSGLVAGLLAVHLGFSGAFLALAVPAAAAFGLVFWLQETREETREQTQEAPERRTVRA